MVAGFLTLLEIGGLFAVIVGDQNEHFDISPTVPVQL